MPKHSNLTKYKIQSWAKKNLRGAAYGGVTEAQYWIQPKKCVICDNPIPWNGRYPKTKQTCSSECANKKRSQSGLIANKGTGGLRQGAGRGKKGYYQGIWCDSTFELAFIIYCLDHSKKVERFKGSVPYTDPITGSSKNYHPDFIVEGKVVEIKGYRSPEVEAKIAAASFEIQLLMGDDLEEMFKYVEAKHNIRRRDLASLYE